jgi:hypothetical protein
MPIPRKPLDKLRKTIAAWPEIDERLSHGHPTFWGGKKTFARFLDNHHGDGRVAVWIKSDFETQADLVESDDDLFFVPPYVGPSGWVGVRLDRDVDWALVTGLLEEAYRSVASKRALMALDGHD